MLSRQFTGSIKTAFCALFLLSFTLSVPALSQDAESGAVDILPARTLSDDVEGFEGDATHPPVRLTPDKSELIRLDRKAATIVVGNPTHVSVLADTAQTLVLVPQQPGATYITILDGKGEVIMQRHVIVASPKEHYIRVRRTCATTEDDGCQETHVYYCPDMCHEVNVAGGDSEANDSSSDGSDTMVEASTEANNEDDETEGGE